MFVDRRRFSHERRVDGRAVSIFAVKAQVGLDTELCQCEDIASSGMALRRTEGPPLPPGMPVALSFQLPGSHGELKVKGVVVTDQPAGQFRRTGVRFTVLSRAVARRLAEHCEERRRTVEWAADAGYPAP